MPSELQPGVSAVALKAVPCPVPTACSPCVAKPEKTRTKTVMEGSALRGVGGRCAGRGLEAPELAGCPRPALAHTAGWPTRPREAPLLTLHHLHVRVSGLRRVLLHNAAQVGRSDGLPVHAEPPGALPVVHTPHPPPPTCTSSGSQSENEKLRPFSTWPFLSSITSAEWVGWGIEGGRVWLAGGRVHVAGGASKRGKLHAPIQNNRIECPQGPCRLQRTQRGGGHIDLLLLRAMGAGAAGQGAA